MNRVSPFIAVALALLVLAVVPPPANGASVAELQTQIEEHNRQIDALEAEIASYQKQLDALGGQRQTLQATMQSLDVSRAQIGKQITVTQNKIANTNLKLQELSFQIGDAEDSIAFDQKAIARSLRDLDAADDATLIERLASSERLADAWTATDAINSLERALGDKIKELAAAKTQLSDTRDEVNAAKRQLVVLQSELASQKRGLDASKAAKQELLTQTKNQESAYQKIIADKKLEEAAFEAALFELASQLTYALDPSHVPSPGSGVLRSPLDTVFVTQQFGKSSSAQRLYASGTHDGVDFRASLGTPVRAALSGTVMAINLGAVQNCQYGKWVLLQHANGLATLYAHLSDITVQKGQTVSTGQVVGLSGTTGYATGPHLHFGVYVAEAVSFKFYTCKSGRTVTIPIAPVSAYLDPLAYL